MLLLAFISLSCLCVAAQAILTKHIKDDIVNSESYAEAYNKYMDTLDTKPDPFLLKSVNSVNSAAQLLKQRKEFMKTLKEIKSHNRKYERGESSYTMTVNPFTIMDDLTKESFLESATPNRSDFVGRVLDRKDYETQTREVGSVSVPEPPATFSFWRSNDYVTPVKSQYNGDGKRCGGGKIFSVIGRLEYAYKAATGNLVSLSEQEVYDCERTDYDTCTGMCWWDVWNYVVDMGRWKYTGKKFHISKETDYPYIAKTTSCKSANYDDVFGAKLKTTNRLYLAKNNEKSLLYDLTTKGPVILDIWVEREWFGYNQGIYDGCKDIKPLNGGIENNHGVLLTGYGRDYFEIKNSFGENWGNQGYGWFQRGRDTCRLLLRPAIIEFEDKDERDGMTHDPYSMYTDPNYNPSYYQDDAPHLNKNLYPDKEEEDEEEEEENTSGCRDTLIASLCQQWRYAGWCSKPLTAKRCPYTCGVCTRDEGDCQDKAGFCKSWRSRGYCETDSSYYKKSTKYCPKTCGVCARMKLDKEMESLIDNSVTPENTWIKECELNNKRYDYMNFLDRCPLSKTFISCMAKCADTYRCKGISFILGYDGECLLFSDLSAISSVNTEMGCSSAKLSCYLATKDRN